MRKTRVYIAGPMTNGKGDGYNLTEIMRAIQAYGDLIQWGYAPMCPQLTMFAQMFQPQTYEAWLGVDLSWLSCADVVLRMPGNSVGADRECAEAHRLGIPIAHGVGILRTSYSPDVQPPRVPQEIA